MSDRPFSEPPEDDDWLEAALRSDAAEHRAIYVEDDGFTSRLMTMLPEPVALPAWRKPALAALWAAAGVGIAFALPGTVIDFGYEVLRVILGQPVSLTGIAAGVIALGVASWAATAVVLRSD